MDLSIIVVNYNTLSTTAACIERVFSLTKGIRFELLLVDNASTDGSRDYFAADKRIKYIYNSENIGFGLANNLALQQAQGRNILFLNPDTLLLGNAAAQLSQYLDTHHEVAVAGGNLYDENMQPALSFRLYRPSILWELSALVGHLPEKILLARRWFFNATDHPLSVGYITGADLAARRNDLCREQGFSDDFFMYYEDTDLCHRLHRRGGKIVALPDVRIQHLEGRSFATGTIPRRRIMLSEQGRDTYYRRNHSRPYHIVANAIYLATLWLHGAIFKALNRPTRYRICRLRSIILAHKQRQLLHHKQ